MSNKRFSNAALCAGLWLACASAQADIISGQVTDSLMHGIANAEVRLKVTDDTSNGANAAITTTDASGNFSFNVDVDPARTVNDVRYFTDPIEITDEVIIEVGAPGYRPRRIGAGERGCHYFCDFSDLDGPRAGTITLTAGSDTLNQDVELEEGGEFEGAITAQTGGAAIPDVPVNVYVDTGDGQGLRPFNAATDTSDASGLWRTGVGLPDGDYHIVAGTLPRVTQVSDTGFGNYVTMAWGGYECQWASCVISATDTVNASAGLLVSNVDFSLPDGAELVGTLYDPSGTQLGAGSDLVILRLYTPDLGVQFANIGTFDGTYRVEGLSGGNYIAEYVPSGQDLSTFVRVLSDGSHCPWGGCERTDAIPLAIPAGATRVHDVFFQEGWKFNVAINDVGGSPINHDDELQIDLIDSASGSIAGGGTDYGTASAPVSGLLTRYGVPAGDYIVALGSRFFGRGGVNNSNYVDAAAPSVNCLGAQCSDSPAITTYSLGGTPGTINVSINAETGHTISGTVTDTGTTPIGGRAVTFLNAAGDVLYHSFTADDGSYRSPALPGGDYRVTVRDGGETSIGFFQADGLGYLGAEHGGGDCMGQVECLDASGALVSIAGADVSNLDFSLSAAPTITGQVVDVGKGLPVFLEVEITNAAGDLVDVYSTYRDGSFTTGGLRPGDYTITPITTRAYSLTTGGTVTKNSTANASQTVTVGSDNVVLNEPLFVTESLIYRDGFRR